MSEPQGQDFIATELLGELKAENDRKSKQIQGLHKLLGACLLLILSIVAAFLIFMNQFELVGEENTTTTATGVYALIDSDGNVIADDLTSEQIEGVLNGYCEQNDVQEGLPGS